MIQNKIFNPRLSFTKKLNFTTKEKFTRFYLNVHVNNPYHFILIIVQKYKIIHVILYLLVLKKSNSKIQDQTRNITPKYNNKFV